MIIKDNCVNLLMLQFSNENEFVKLSNKILNGELKSSPLSMEIKHNNEEITKKDRNIIIKKKFKSLSKIMLCKKAYVKLAKQYGLKASTIRFIIYSKV